jgi:hypothetical protein
MQRSFCPRQNPADRFDTANKSFFPNNSMAKLHLIFIFLHFRRIPFLQHEKNRHKLGHHRAW